MRRDTVTSTDEIWAWRHPRADGGEGRCIGRTDVPIDRRKAKRLARRVQQAARKGGLPRVVVTSTLRRSADVGRWLRRWGWTHRSDARLAELDFGAWDGQPWAAIGRDAVDEWCADFARHAPGGGESVCTLLERARCWQADGAAVVIGHAGWMAARRWVQEVREAPRTSAQWPVAPRHGTLWKLQAMVGRTLRSPP